MARVPLPVRVTPELAGAVDEFAQAEGLSRTAAVELLLVRGLNGAAAGRRGNPIGAQLAAVGGAHQPGPNVENIRSSGQVKRDVEPVPKGRRR